MPSFDHLVTLPDRMEGTIVSTKSLTSGTSFIIVDDSGINIGNRRRWVGHSQEVTPIGTELKPGTRVQFLPGTPRGGHKMPRAYSIEVVGANVR